MSQADSPRLQWRPPWRRRSAADIALVLQSTPLGLAFDLTGHGRQGSDLFKWVLAWLAAYLNRLSPLDRGADVTFFYVLSTHPLGMPTGGVSEHEGPIEVGFGSEPVGPADGRPVRLEDLLRLTLETFGG